MAASILSSRLRLCHFNVNSIEVISGNVLSHYCPTSCLAGFISARHGNTKSLNPKFRHLRRKKILKVDLPDFEEQRRNEKLTPDEIRSKMKEKGIVPERPYSEKPMLISSTSQVFEAFVPPEGDGKKSIISKQGAVQRLALLQKKGKSMMSLRKIRKFEEKFEIKDFTQHAQDIYVEVHEKLTDIKENEDRLHDLVTEKCYPEMMHNMEKKTVRWKFIKSLEEPSVSHIRTTEIFDKSDVFAQVTVRFHSQQTLAVYDRFGRLIHGSEVVAKDVIEYVVFEKHLADNYGQWRIHEKILPTWLEPKDCSPKTHVMTIESDKFTKEEKEEQEKDLQGVQKEMDGMVKI